MRLAVVVVTYNAADLVGDCLRSIPAGIDVVVIDNASADGTAAVARAARPDATVVGNPANTGFAAAAAQGLELVAHADAAMLLNPDACLAPGALEQLAAFLDEHPRAGLVSALVVDEAGRPEAVAGGPRLTLPALALYQLGLSRFAPARAMYQRGPTRGPEQRGWVAGTAVLARRTAVAQVGGPDPAYFLYCEDRDWCDRMWQAGWQVWALPSAVAVHYRSATVNTAGSWVDAYRIGSLDRYWRARSSGAGLVGFRLLRAAGIGARALVFTAAAVLTRSPQRAARARQRRRDARIALALLVGREP